MLKIMIAVATLIVVCTSTYAMSCKECEDDFMESMRKCGTDATCIKRAKEELAHCKVGCRK